MNEKGIEVPTPRRGLHQFGRTVDTNTPAGKLMFTMLSAFAEFERNIIKERLMFGSGSSEKAEEDPSDGRRRL
jgi:DNA invertase Pin-like site-specific DNA recombinase